VTTVGAPSLILNVTATPFPFVVIDVSTVASRYPRFQY